VEMLDGSKTQIKSAVNEEFVKQLMIKMASTLQIPTAKLNLSESGNSQYKSREGINIDYINEAISP
jgi:hypothetical protein